MSDAASEATLAAGEGLSPRVTRRLCAPAKHSCWKQWKIAARGALLI